MSPQSYPQLLPSDQMSMVKKRSQAGGGAHLQTQRPHCHHCLASEVLAYVPGRRRLQCWCLWLGSDSSMFPILLFQPVSLLGRIYPAKFQPKLLEALLKHLSLNPNQVLVVPASRRRRNELWGTMTSKKVQSTEGSIIWTVCQATREDFKKKKNIVRIRIFFKNLVVTVFAAMQ